ncbi:22304_t:CDS:2 [Rhizophagus irregularis]|nr:22304_t:CDS:2 [Rhizophagus irregularis]
MQSRYEFLLNKKDAKFLSRNNVFIKRSPPTSESTNNRKHSDPEVEDHLSLGQYHCLLPMVDCPLGTLPDGPRGPVRCILVPVWDIKMSVGASTTYGGLPVCMKP